MVFDFLDYRAYLEEKLGKKGTRSGARKRLAEYMGGHTTFISQVLNGQSELSLEQAEVANEFLEHSFDEGEFFIYLVMIARAGTPVLKNRFVEKVRLLKEKRLKIKDRLKAEGSINKEDQQKFYSSYHYGAVHVLASIPGQNTIEAISLALKLPRSKVVELVEFLVKLGVLVRSDSKVEPGKNHIHLSNENELVLSHHRNWRQHTISRLQFLNKEDVHYSACVSLSHKDAFQVKESLLGNLEKNVQVISKSAEEVAYVYSLDFYKLSDD